MIDNDAPISLLQLAINEVVSIPPQTLYHYTSAQGLEGIMGTRELWATHVRYLNDLTEYRLAFEFATGLIETDADLKQKYPKIPHLLGLIKSKIQEQDVYVASFSNDGGDRLSQWRGYGSTGGAFSIGFGAATLLKSCSAASHKGNTMPLTFCKYGNEGHPSLQNLFAVLKDRLDKPAGASSIEDGIAMLRRLLVEFYSAIGLVAARSKHSGFDEEREWRLVAVGTTAKDEEQIGFHSRNTSIVPHLRIPLHEEGGQIQLESIRVGPIPHPEEAVRAVRMLLTKYKVACNTVQKSEIPYRYW
jgi:hypothetical protein